MSDSDNAKGVPGSVEIDGFTGPTDWSLVGRGGTPPGSLTPEERAADVYDAIQCSADGPDAEVRKIAAAIRAAVAEELESVAEAQRRCFEAVPAELRIGGLVADLLVTVIEDRIAAIRARANAQPR